MSPDRDRRKSKATPARGLCKAAVFLMFWCGYTSAIEYQYTEAREARAENNSDRLAIVQSDFAINVPARQILRGDDSLHWQHRYTQLKQDIDSPLHNGHLHDSRLRWQSDNTLGSRWRAEWSLGAAMSSNRFKDIEFDVDGIVLEGRALRVFPLSETLSVLAGMQANYLFNGYRVLPEFGLHWRSSLGDMSIDTSRFNWRYPNKSRGEISLALVRSASKWLALDNDSSIESEVYMRSVTADVAYKVALADAWAIKFSAGYTQVRKLNFANRFNESVSSQFERVPRVGLALIRN